MGPKQMRACAAAAASLIGASAGGASGQLFGGGTTVFRNAAVLSADDTVNDGVTIEVRGGSIARIVRGGTSSGSGGGGFLNRTREVDLDGRFVTAGLIDADASLAFRRGEGDPDPTAEAFDAFDPHAGYELTEALRRGVTAVFVEPRGAAGVNGLGALVRLGPDGHGGLGLIVEDAAALSIDLGSGETAVARLRSFDEIVKAFDAAEAYRESREIYDDQLETYGEALEKLAEEDTANADDDEEGGRDDEAQADDDADDGPEKPARPRPDAAAEVLLRALDRDIAVRIRADRSRDIMNALELIDRYNLRGVITGASEAHLLAERLAEADTAVVLDAWPGGSEDGVRRSTAAALESAGVRWSVGTASTPGSTPMLLEAAQLAVRGTEAPGAVHAATRRAAAVLGVDDRLGRLGPGRPADMVVWSGHPLDPGSYVEAVYVGGEKVYDRIEDGGTAR